LSTGENLAYGSTLFPVLNMAITLTQQFFANDPVLHEPPTGVPAAWPKPWPVLELSYGDRQRSRLAAMLPNGKAVAVILARGENMQHGGVLCGEQGERVVVQAAVEELMRIRASNTFELMRIVYHLANRHVRAMLTPESAFIEPDSVLADMVRRQGGLVDLVQEAFVPEGGAYSAGQGAAGHHHHHHADECGDVARDEAMGKLGEELSIAAHAKK
jgi:urease accessory protein